MPKGRIITAPHGTNDVDALDGPLIYLAGPIQGCWNWQCEATAILRVIADDLHVASPRSKNFNGGVEKHLAWSNAYIERAACNGVIVWWFASETRARSNRAFGGQARFELGEWCVKAQAGLARLVVGFEPGFPGGTYLKRRLTLSYPKVPICRTLLQTCTVAAELAREEAPTIMYPRTLANLFVPNVLPKSNS